MRTFLIIFIIFGASLGGSISTAGAVGAAYFSEDTTLQVTISGVTYNLTAVAGSDADSVVVNTSSIEVTMSVGQRFILTSSDRLILSNDGGFSTACTSSSTLDLSLGSGASQTTITITPSTSRCVSFAPGGFDAPTVNGGGGLGLGSPSPSVTPTPQARITPTIIPKPLPVRPLPTSSPGMAQVIGGISYLNVRSSASTKGKILAKVFPRDVLQYIDTSKGWYRIKKNGKTLGWVLGDYIVTSSMASGSGTSSVGKLRVITGLRYLNVRTNPSTRSKVVGRALPGQEYQFTNSSSGWYLIQKNSKDIGWVSGEYTELR